jgi:hypothetical protein
MQITRIILAGALALSGLFAQAPAPPKHEAPAAKSVITDADRFHIREAEARLLQVDNQVKDWQLTGRPDAQKAIQALYQEAQAKCGASEQLDPATIECKPIPKAPETPTAKAPPPGK